MKNVLSYIGIAALALLLCALLGITLGASCVTGIWAATHALNTTESKVAEAVEKTESVTIDASTTSASFVPETRQTFRAIRPSVERTFANTVAANVEDADELLDLSHLERMPEGYTVERETARELRNEFNAAADRANQRLSGGL